MKKVQKLEVKFITRVRQFLCNHKTCRQMENHALKFCVNCGKVMLFCE